MKLKLKLFLENEVIDWLVGGEKNIFQNEVLGEGMVENEEIFTLKLQQI